MKKILLIPKNYSMNTASNYTINIVNASRAGATQDWTDVHSSNTHTIDSQRS